MTKSSNSNQSDLAQLRWACRRGMLELDVLLGNFLEGKYDSLSKEEQDFFQEFLKNSDPDLFAWLTGKSVPEDPLTLAMVDKIRNYAKYRN